MSIPAARATRRGLTNVYPPKVRTVNQLTGEITGRPDKFFQALSEADNFCRENAAVDEYRKAFTAAVGFYSCPCESEFEFNEHSTLEDYAALHRWLGRHESHVIGGVS